MSGTIRHLRPTAGITVRAADDAFLDQVRATPTRLCAIWAGAAAWPASPKTRSATPSNSCEARRRSTPGTRGAPPCWPGSRGAASRAHRADRPGPDQTLHPAGLRHPGPQPHRARPAYRPPRHPRAGEDADTANLPPARPSATATSAPTPGHARLSYGQARAQHDAATATAGTPHRRDSHELRHTGHTHLGEAGRRCLAHGQIAPPQTREPAPILQTLTRSHTGDHQPAWTRSRLALTPSRSCTW